MLYTDTALSELSITHFAILKNTSLKLCLHLRHFYRFINENFDSCYTCDSCQMPLKQIVNSYTLQLSFFYKAVKVNLKNLYMICFAKFYVFLVIQVD